MRLLIVILSLGWGAQAAEMGPRVEQPKSITQETGSMVARMIDQSMRRGEIKDFQGHCFALEGETLKQCRSKGLSDTITQR